MTKSLCTLFSDKDSSEGQVLIDVDDFVGGGTETHRNAMDNFWGQIALFPKRCQSMLLSSTFKPFGLHVYHRFLKDVDPFGHGLTWTPLEFLTKALLHWSLLRGLFHANGSLELRSFPHECLCLYPLSDEFDWARWSQRTFLLSLSDGTAVELREKSLRQASPRFHWRLSPSHAGTRYHVCFSSLMFAVLMVLALRPAAARFWTRRLRSVCPVHSVSLCSVPGAQRLTGGTLRVRRTLICGC